MANRALDVLMAAGRGLSAAARRLWAMERGFKLFLLSIALFLVGLACALAGARGAAAVWGALAVASMVACVLTPSPLWRAELARAELTRAELARVERARAAASDRPTPGQPASFSQAPNRPTEASGRPAEPAGMPRGRGRVRGAAQGCTLIGLHSGVGPLGGRWGHRQL